MVIEIESPEYRYADTFNSDDWSCYACGLDLKGTTCTSYENPSFYDWFTGKFDHVMVHFRLCIPCGDKIRGTVLTESQKLKRHKMLRAVEELCRGC